MVKKITRKKGVRKFSPAALARARGAAGSSAGAKGGGKGQAGGGGVTPPVPMTDFVESIEHFTCIVDDLATTGTVTITEVDPTRSVIISLGSNCYEIIDAYGQGSLYLTNGTTITGERDIAAWEKEENDLYIYGIVLQFADNSIVNAVQRGSIDVPGIPGQDTGLQVINEHITPVIIENTLVFQTHHGWQGNTNGAPAQPRCHLSSSSNLRCERAQIYKQYGYTLKYEICEFVGTGDYATSTTTTTTS